MPGQWKDEEEHGESKNAAGGVWSGRPSKALSQRRRGWQPKGKDDHQGRSQTSVLVLG